MHLSTTLLVSLLPGLIAADQIPLKEKAAEWINRAKDSIYNVAEAIPNPIDAGAAKVAEKKVTKITSNNWNRKLAPKAHGPEEWLVYITGGNKTCFGRCEHADLKWNESVPLLLALPQDNLHLGKINCEIDSVLCTAWGAGLPSVYHFSFPQKAAAGQTQAKTPLHPVPLNLTSAEVSDITSIPSSADSAYLKWDEYDGLLHPVDGFFAKYGLLIPLGWFLWGFGTTPSWIMMMVISFFSRQYMTRRAMGRTGGVGGGTAAPAGAGGARPAPMAAPAANPAANLRGKKRR